MSAILVLGLSGRSSLLFLVSDSVLKLTSCMPVWVIYPNGTGVPIMLSSRTRFFAGKLIVRLLFLVIQLVRCIQLDFFR